MSFSSPTSQAQRSRRILPWLLYLYALVLFAMHFVRIFDNSFWGDEGFTIRLVKASFYRMCRLTAGDVHPPLYYFFTQILYHIFGNHGYTYSATTAILTTYQHSFPTASSWFWPVQWYANGSA